MMEYSEKITPNSEFVGTDSDECNRLSADN